MQPAAGRPHSLAAERIPGVGIPGVGIPGAGIPGAEDSGAGIPGAEDSGVGSLAVGNLEAEDWTEVGSLFGGDPFITPNICALRQLFNKDMENCWKIYS